MKFLVLALCVCAAAAAPQQSAYKPWQAGSDVDAAVLRSDYDVKPEGSYNYAYETANGIAAAATGTVKKIDNQEFIAVEGSYQYIAADGTPVLVTYVADENGYQPKSDLLPVAPAVPDAIVRSLQWIAAHPAAVEPKYKA